MYNCRLYDNKGYRWAPKEFRNNKNAQLLVKTRLLIVGKRYYIFKYNLYLG